MAESALARLLQLEQELEQATGLQQVPAIAVEWARRATGASDGGLLLIEAGRQARLVLPRPAERPGGEADRALRRVLRLALTSWARQRWAQLFIPDIQATPWSAEELAPWRSILAVPLSEAGKVRGILLLTHRQANRFADWQADLLRAAAPRIVSAMPRRPGRQSTADETAHLAEIVDCLTEPLLALDAAGRVILANPPLERLVGRPAAELLGRDFRQVLPLEHPSQPDVIAQVLQGIYASFDLDMVLRDAGGEAIPVRVGCGAIPGENGRPDGAAIVLRDIRFLKEIEGLREDLSNMLIHDLKGPLAAVASTIQLLQQYPPAKMGEATLQELLSIADQGARRLGRLIEAVLDVHHMETGQFPLTLQPVDLSALVIEVLAEVGPLAVAAEIETSVDIPPGLPTVSGDAAVLSRVLWNLLDNALKYTPRGGRIKISAREAAGPAPGREGTGPGDTSTGRWVLVHVADTGVGIPAEDRERIFGKFAQGRRGPLRRRGIGLGLAFCRLAVEAHGGRIWVEGDRAGGSVFAFTLPVQPSGPITKGTKV